MCADMDAIVEIHPGREALARELAGRVAAAAREAVAAHGRFMLAIPGGSVLALLAAGWAGQAGRGDGWHVFWTDERCVPPGDARSNARAAQAEWFGPLGLSHVQLHPADGPLGPVAAAAACEADLARTFGLAPGQMPVFDLRYSTRPSRRPSGSP
jgi:6-phosphogluconolactonase